MIRSILLLLLLSATIPATAQKTQIKQGNKLYQKGSYQDAAKAYQEALAKDPKNRTGLFNLGNALYQQKQFEAARKALATTTQVTTEKTGKSAASYNIGNTYMHERKWQEAVNAYKQALRNNPQDPDAKYNLSYALAMMKKEQGGGGGGKDDKKDDKGQDKDNKDQQNQDQNKQEQNKQEQNKEEEEKQDQQRQQQPSKLSEQQAEQLLNALQQEERKLQDKMQKSKGMPVKVEKDW